ncbi:MAG: AMP-binding enzyme, partial [Nostoc sp.]
YLSQQELTAASFVPDPFSAVRGARLYRTGDLARFRDDAVIEFMGRNDDQVKIRGFRIEPGEIEAVLRMHSLVREAAILVREDGPGRKRLVAYIAVESSVTPGELRGWLRERMPDYMVPAAWVFLSKLPLNSNG